METSDDPTLSEQTRAEQALGKKTAAENAAKLEAAERSRLEENKSTEISEADKAANEAKPLKRKGFPVADDKVKI